MRYRFAAIVFFAVVGLLELADFADKIATLSNEAKLQEAAQFLGVTLEGQRIRLTLLLPLTALIGALSLSVVFGALRGDRRRSQRLIVAGLLFFYMVFQALTAAVFEPAAAALAFLFGVLCLLAWWFAKAAAPAEPA